MNSITLSEHRCANKCTDFKKTGEQCGHCLVSEPVVNQDFSNGDLVVYVSLQKSAQVAKISKISTKNRYAILTNGDVVNFDSIRRATDIEKRSGFRTLVKSQSELNVMIHSALAIVENPENHYLPFHHVADELRKVLLGGGA